MNCTRAGTDTNAGIARNAPIVIDYMKALQRQLLYNVGENKKKEVLQHEKVLWM